MPSLSIITPWSGATGEALLPDYANACQHADEIVTINNACDHVTSTMLAQFHEQGGTLLTNASNLGFAAANNQGYARATGDIVIFLNSDVAADPRWLECVAADVKDGALYGPALAHQLVAGRWLPYIEGWCIAATRATWERLRISEITRTESGKAMLTSLHPPGPWDADAYPFPYWEDNDLCLRALQAGLSLVQTAWPIQHKGGRTAGPIAKHGKSFAQNERTFTDRVLAALEAEIAPTPTWERYQRYLTTPSDIQHHLPLLYSLARGNVVELGTRTGVSTAALLAGVEAHGGKVTSIDVQDCGALFPDNPNWMFIKSDSRNPDLVKRMGAEIDLLLVDSEHVYEITAAELALWGPHMRPGGTILLHDPETFPGVRRAAREFAAARGWPITIVLPCNGMAIIEVPG